MTYIFKKCPSKNFKTNPSILGPVNPILVMCWKNFLGLFISNFYNHTSNSHLPFSFSPCRNFSFLTYPQLVGIRECSLKVYDCFISLMPTFSYHAFGVTTKSLIIKLGAPFTEWELVYVIQETFRKCQILNLHYFHFILCLQNHFRWAIMIHHVQ